MAIVKILQGLGVAQAAVTAHWPQNNCIYLLVMPKYWGKQISASRVSPKCFKSKRQKKRKKITMASYALQTPPRVAHAKLPGPKILNLLIPFRLLVVGQALHWLDWSGTLLNEKQDGSGLCDHSSKYLPRND